MALGHLEICVLFYKFGCLGYFECFATKQTKSTNSVRTDVLRHGSEDEVCYALTQVRQVAKSTHR